MLFFLCALWSTFPAVYCSRETHARKSRRLWNSSHWAGTQRQVLIIKKKKCTYSFANNVTHWWTQRKRACDGWMEKWSKLKGKADGKVHQLKMGRWGGGRQGDNEDGGNLEIKGTESELWGRTGVLNICLCVFNIPHITSLSVSRNSWEDKPVRLAEDKSCPKPQQSPSSSTLRLNGHPAFHKQFTLRHLGAVHLFLHRGRQHAEDRQGGSVPGCFYIL